jgi:nucleotide-binding universal stress UspA family protein
VFEVIRRILTPTDGSETAQAAVLFAKDIAKAEDAEVVVLGVVHSLQYGDTTTYDASPEIEADLKVVVDAEVAQLMDAGVKASGVTVPGDEVARAIIDEIGKEHADVVVMGTHGRGTIVRTVIGSVADEVVRHSDVPVLLVPTHH